MGLSSEHINRALPHTHKSESGSSGGGSGTGAQVPQQSAFLLGLSPDPAEEHEHGRPNHVLLWGLAVPKEGKEDAGV